MELVPVVTLTVRHGSILSQFLVNFNNGLPKRVRTDGQSITEDTLEDENFIFERPREDGTILMYRRTTEDIKALITYLIDVGVSIPETLNPGFWRSVTACTGSRNCSTHSCTTGTCQVCNTGGGNYCCCLSTV
jgi:hypothetical protein